MWLRKYFNNDEVFPLCGNGCEPILTHSIRLAQRGISIPPENIRKPKVFWRFQGVQKWSTELKWFNLEKLITHRTVIGILLLLLLSCSCSLAPDLMTTYWFCNFSAAAADNLGPHFLRSKFMKYFLEDLLICGALRDLVLFVKFKKREKHPWRSVNFST